MSYDNCDVYIEGSLNTMPTVSKNGFGEAEIIIGRKHRKLDEIEYYRITLKWPDAADLLTYGYIGMYITVSGILRAKNQIEIVAERISFIGFSGIGSFELACNDKISRLITSTISNNNPCVLH